MSVEIVALRGPLDDEKLGWLVDLYGPVDEKYASLDFVRHQFVGNPFGWSAHVFALDHGRPVGHSGAVPFVARRGDEELVAGKIEAVTVDAAYRGRRAEDGGSVATDVLSTLYPFAVENGMRVLFGLAPPGVARVHARAGCRLLPLDAPAYTAVLDPRSWGSHEPSRSRRVAASALAAGQRAAMLALRAPARVASSGPARVSDPAREDAPLADGPHGLPGWTISGADAWEWYRGSGVLRTLEVGGAHGSRGLVRPGTGASPAQIVAWEPRRPGIVPAALFLEQAARVASARGAPTLRFQPWKGDAAERTLARACRLLGFVQRPEANLVVYSTDTSYDDVRLTPFFYVTF
ncbi:MAG TPA: hypothetical protein VFA19_05230 [Gaiellaceae bacterium]|nr:hypothetical protein [Gaiellaceae bacterium]